MEAVTFHSDSPYMQIRYNLLPEIPATPRQYARGEGIMFRQGIYQTSDPNEIAALRGYIMRFRSGQGNVLVTCPIWEDETERQNEVQEIQVAVKKKQVQEKRLHDETVVIDYLRG